MPLKNDRMWMFWSVLLIVIGIVLLNLEFNLQYTRSAEEARAETTASGDAGKNELERAVDFTKKAACRMNVQVIETQVELWFINHGFWPKGDMSDIGRDIDYFPKGVPKCPVSGEPYALDPVTHRVVGHGHGDIATPEERQPERQELPR